ncbi:MAG: CHAT domain-containing protein [Saprospiraceae bacterium]|nr:CHAT domain-containing protein [Saprospiraceae bacterium]
MKFKFLMVLILISHYISSQSDTSIVLDKLDSLFVLCDAYSEKGSFKEAFDVIVEAENLSIKWFGKESASYGDVCYFRAFVYKLKLEYGLAEKWLFEAKAIQFKVLGENHPYYSATINTLGAVYIESGDLVKGEECLLQSKKLKEKYEGKENDGYAVVLINIGSFYQRVGRYEEASLYYLEAKELYEKHLGKDKRHYPTTLNNLASLNTEIAQFELAETYYFQALSSTKLLFGEQSPPYALIQDNIARLYQIMGNYEKAEWMFLEALNTRKASLGTNHPNYASSLNNCATLFRQLGKYDKAEIFLLEAIEILEKTLGKENEWYCSTLQNRIDVQSRKGNYQKAIEMQIELNNIWLKTQGDSSLTYSKSQIALASYYMSLGFLQEAEKCYQIAIKIVEKKLGKKHYSYAENLSHLASLYIEKQNYKLAEKLQLESIKITEKVLGTEHINYANRLFNLGLIYELMGKFKKSESLFSISSAVIRKNIMNALFHLSEQEMNQFILTFAAKQALILSFAHNTNGRTKIATTCFDNSLFFKGFLLNAFNNNRHLIGTDSITIAKINLLKSYSHLLAKEYSKPILLRKGVKELEEKSNELEKTIARLNIDFDHSTQQISWKEVQKLLSPDEAIIDFIHFNYSNKRGTDSIIYAAMVLKSGNQLPLYIPLVESKQLEELMTTKKGQNNLTQLYAFRGVNPIKVISMNTIYNLVWKNLKGELTGIKKIYYTPTGLLHRINFDAIPINDTTILSDQYQLNRLNSPRQLMFPKTMVQQNNVVTMYGGIQFDRDSFFGQTETHDTILKYRKGDIVNFRSIDTTNRGGSWNYLIGTEMEINSIEAITKQAGMQNIVRSGNQATEESFKSIGTNNMPSPRILHIATHGYFFPDPDRTNSAKSGVAQDSAASEGTAQAASLNPIAKFEATETVFKMSEHPMLRSGLIMAGGNEAWQGKQTLEDREDGILTAYEISQMNLSSTELVVLSACETGLGDIQGNEGVYGLQRAFKIAGAKYLIMSLWQVPDKQTSLLMTTFYKKWLEDEGPDKGGKKMTIPDAFHAAQKELRELGLDPYQWAGFVLVE